MTISKRAARVAGKQTERPVASAKAKEAGAPAESRDKGWQEEEIILLILPGKRPVSSEAGGSGVMEKAPRQ